MQDEPNNDVNTFWEWIGLVWRMHYLFSKNGSRFWETFHGAHRQSEVTASRWHLLTCHQLITRLVIQRIPVTTFRVNARFLRTNLQRFTELGEGYAQRRVPGCVRGQRVPCSNRWADSWFYQCGGFLAKRSTVSAGARSKWQRGILKLQRKCQIFAVARHLSNDVAQSWC